MKNDMRVILTKRLLKEGLLRLLETTPISKITVTELCKESGINRATFYKHYEMPIMILREIAFDYAFQMKNIYTNEVKIGHSKERALEAMLMYPLDKKEDIKILFSEHAEHTISGFMLEIVKDFVTNDNTLLQEKVKVDMKDYYLYAVLTSYAFFGLLESWIVRDIDKTPKEIVAILRNALGELISL